MGPSPKPDPHAPATVDDPAGPAEGPVERESFEFVERPRIEGEIYISRPLLGRDPAQRDR